MTSHLAVQNAAGHALIPCLVNVSAGARQWVYAYQIDFFGGGWVGVGVDVGGGGVGSDTLWKISL